MPTPVLHKVGAEFDERNMFLQAALGLIALLQRGRALLRRYGTVSGSAPASPLWQRGVRGDFERGTSGQIPLDPPLLKGEPSPDDDPPFLYLVLGAIALSHHLLRHLPALSAPSSAQRPGTASTAGAPVAERSLRELLE